MIKITLENYQKIKRTLDEKMRKIADGDKGLAVGFDKSSGQRNGVDVVDYARWNHYGVQNTFSAMVKHKKFWKIPPRPFLDVAIEESKQLIYNTAEEAMKLVVDGKIDKTEALHTLGRVAVSAVKSKIRTLAKPSNAPATIKKKGFNNPLIETKKMHNNVKYFLTKKVD